MLVAHVEQDGVWLVEGGMHRVADAIRDLAESQGTSFRFNAEVEEILVQNGRAAGVRLAGGETLAADAVVFNGDVAALGQGLLGGGARRAARDTPRAARSLSAVTWCMNAVTHGFPLAHHNVFFAEDYAAEFAAIFRARQITEAPTVYICAQDRGHAEVPPGTPERLLVLVNAPADGDLADLPPEALEALRQRSLALLRRCGLIIETTPANTTTTTPAGFDSLFPGTGGALYGRASHGATGTFARPGATSHLPGLFLAGGSVHPGPGIPMAAMSGRLAAARVLAAGRRR
jgi:1-hydroxycarotenoid 3,4-desaturase